MRNLILSGILAMTSAHTALADDIIKTKTDKSVTEAMDALEAPPFSIGSRKPLARVMS